MAARRRRAKRLCLVRCGETTWERDGRVCGAADLPLSDNGRATITSLANAWAGERPSVVYHPDDEAAAATAGIIAAALKVKTKVASDLGNPSLGLLEGLTEAAFADRFPRRRRQWLEDPMGVAAPEGDDLAEAATRILLAAGRIVKKDKSEAALVLHDFGLAVLRCWLAGRTGEAFRSMLDDRPRVERYLLASETAEALLATPSLASS